MSLSDVVFLIKPVYAPHLLCGRFVPTKSNINMSVLDAKRFVVLYVTSSLKCDHVACALPCGPHSFSPPLCPYINSYSLYSPYMGACPYKSELCFVDLLVFLFGFDNARCMFGRLTKMESVMLC